MAGHQGFGFFLNNLKTPNNLIQIITIPSQFTKRLRFLGLVTLFVLKSVTTECVMTACRPVVTEVTLVTLILLNLYVQRDMDRTHDIPFSVGSTKSTN